MGQRLILGNALHVAGAGPAVKHEWARASPILQTFAASAKIRRLYTVDQAMLPVAEGDTIEAISRDGVVELPSIGYFRVVARRGSSRVLVRLTPTPAVVLGGTNGRFFSTAKIGDQLEVLNHIPHAFRVLLWEGNPSVRPASRLARRDWLPRAIAALKAVGVLEMVTGVTNSIVLFCGGTKNSFYDFRAHGAIFVRCSRSQDVFHLIEELVHQSGHAALATLLLDPSRFLRGSKRSLSQRLTLDRQHSRSVLVAFHGLVTEALVAETLHRVFTRLRSKADRHQLAGRLAFATRKLSEDLSAFVAYTEILVGEGVSLLRAIISTCEGVLRCHGSLIGRVDLTGQPYVFSQKRYLAVNRM